MESKEEIKLMSEKYATTHEDVSDRLGKYLVSACFQDGYTQCQEDMADKRYTLDDMKKACACGIDIVCKEGPNDFQLFEDLINSINKQD